ncbi:MAG TPA: purine-nucleoside phosphorylase [Bryobacteraceae bacterium]|nr:purine-nucleoside phosphorylase [Bryobacteraceae bacterium]
MDAAVAYIRGITGREPRVAVVLGSGLGAFADDLDNPVSIPYSDIPGWPASTAIGHSGKLVFGKLDKLDIAVLAGRAHLYEGYTPAQVTLGIRVLHQLGVRSVVLTNAAGGIKLSYRQGGLVLISDHINLQGSNPLIGPNDDSAGPRFPDMTEAYSLDYRKKAHQVAQQLHIQLDEGVYAAFTGPSYETPAEIHYLRAIGADLVGMSTVPEAIVANYLGMRVLAISCVTNMAAGILPQKLDHKEVMETGHRVRDTLIRFLKALLPKL